MNVGKCFVVTIMVCILKKKKVFQLVTKTTVVKVYGPIFLFEVGEIIFSELTLMLRHQIGSIKISTAWSYISIFIQYDPIAFFITIQIRPNKITLIKIIKFKRLFHHNKMSGYFSLKMYRMRTRISLFMRKTNNVPTSTLKILFLKKLNKLSL